MVPSSPNGPCSSGKTTSTWLSSRARPGSWTMRWLAELSLVGRAPRAARLDLGHVPGASRRRLGVVGASTQLPSRAIPIGMTS